MTITGLGRRRTLVLLVAAISTLAMLGPAQARGHGLDDRPPDPPDIRTGRGGAATQNPGPAFPRNPVVLVHGCAFAHPRQHWTLVHGYGEASEAYAGYQWGGLLEAFRRAGYPDDHLAVLMYSEPCGRNRSNSEELAEAVEAVLAATGKKRVDLVGHSMGCLSTRLYVAGPGRRLVGNLIVSAGVCHGHDGVKTDSDHVWGAIWGAMVDAHRRLTPMGEFEGMADLHPAYSCEGVQAELNGCFDSDTGQRSRPFRELQPRIRTYSIYSDTDVEPFHTSCLDQAYRGDCGSHSNILFSGRGHDLHNDPDVAELIVGLLASAKK